MNMLRSVILLIAVALCCFSNVFAKTWHVRKDGTGDTGSIKTGVDGAGPGDTVLVGSGSYYEETIYIEKSVHVISEAGFEETVIIHMGSPSTEENVIWVEGAIDCSIIGFTIRGGRCDWASIGGGLLIRWSNVLVMNNRILDNWCANGGGIATFGDPAPSIINNLIFANGAFVGGGIYVHDSSPTIKNNTIVANSVSVIAGGVRVMGDSKPIIKYNLICYNVAPSGYCGGVDCSSDIDSLVFECNNIWSNWPEGTDYCGTISDLIGIYGNMSVDPLFCGEYGSDNYYLQQGSPCAEENVPECCNGIRIGCYPVNCTTAIEESTWGKMKSLMKEGGSGNEERDSLPP